MDWEKIREKIKKYKIVLILLAVIAVFAIIVGIRLLIFNPPEREKFSEVEIIETFIDAINEGDGEFITYAETYCTQKKYDFYNFYVKLIDKNDKEYDEETKLEIEKVIGNGYEDEFDYLKMHFGEEYKITYNIIKEENLDARFYMELALEDPPGIETATFAQGCGVNMVHLFGIGASPIDVAAAVVLNEAVEDFEIEISDVKKYTVEFCVAGADKEVEFEEEIYYFTVNDELIPVVYVGDEEESYFITLKLTPEYIYRKIGGPLSST